jgi:2-(3-amino-3-carboxypropyl)histidine synthase
MISNPHLPAYQYDPYSKKFTKETYKTEDMHKIRKDAIQQASYAKVCDRCSMNEIFLN